MSRMLELVRHEEVVLEEWRALREELPAAVLRLVLVDVDGVLTGGEGQAADLRVLERVAALSAESLREPSVPAVALCTGRPAPFVELMAQMVGAFLPCIFEHGAGLFFPKAFRYVFNPALGPGYAARLAALRAALEEPLLLPGRAFVQPGKEATMTLYPLGDTSVDELVARAREAIAPLGDAFTVEWNLHGVELRPQGIHKGLGAQWLAREIGVPLSQAAGVGDSDSDLSFLRLVGFPAAPANATAPVRAEVEQVASRGFGDGLLEILEGVIRRNRALLTR